ncbi:tetraspanin-7 isoform X2 [Castor canadensis]|uniref:Tetraspanin-7 isoform X2 n=1 Tax=Castor canadensis TaxID=51338 RepID=A0AC58LRS5_CASCN
MGFYEDSVCFYSFLRWQWNRIERWGWMDMCTRVLNRRRQKPQEEEDRDCNVVTKRKITGVILLAVGVWGKLTLGTYISLIAENSTNAPYVLIGTGTTIVVFGLFGCFATCRGSPWMLKLYAMFLSLVFLAELVAGISGFVFRHEIKDTFLRTYTDAMQNYNGNDERSRAVDHVQRSLSCCGVQNYTNWSTSPYFLEHGIPPSCCMNETDCNAQDLHNLTVAATKVNQKGCYDLVTSFMETNMGIIAGVAFGIAFSQLIGMLLACCLSRFITANQYEMV